MNLKKERKTMKTETKQTTRTGTESEKWTSRGEFQWGRGGGENERKVQGIRSINAKYKIDKRMLRTVQEMEKPKNLYVRSMVMN